MDTVALKDKAVEFTKQYRYVILVLLIGVALMLFPGKQTETPAENAAEETLKQDITQQSLEEILSQIEGVGKVKVMLTVAAGEEIIYEYDEDQTLSQQSDTHRREAVIVTDDTRGEQGLIQQVISPTYQGAIVVCQGGDRASIRLSIVEAVSSVTGLTAEKITVLKMK